MEGIFLEIQDCITLYKFDAARKHIQGCNNIKSSADGLRIKLLSLQLKAKEREHRDKLQCSFLGECLQAYLALFAEIQVLDPCLDSLHLQLQCCSNMLSLLIANPDDSLHDLSFLQYFSLFLRDYCEMFWNETSALPAKLQSFSSSKRMLVNDLICHVTDSLKFVCIILKDSSDTFSVICLLSLLLDFSFWMICRHQEGRIIAQLLKQISNVIDGNRHGIETNQSGFFDLRFNKRSSQDIRNDLDLLFLLHSLRHRSKASDVIIKEYEITSLKEFNSLLCVLKGIYLYNLRDYESCYSHINELLKFTVYTSQLSLVQFSLVHSLYAVCAVYLEKVGTFEQIVFSPPCSHDCFQATFALHQIAVHGINQNTEDCIKLLNKILKMNKKKTELPFLISNFLHSVDVFLLRDLNKGCPPISYKDWLLFPYLTAVPKLYIHQKLSTLLFNEKRYGEAYESFQAVFTMQNRTTDGGNSACEFDSPRIDSPSFYRNFCYCCMALRRFDESLDILTSLKEGGLSNVWMLAYEAEIQRRFNNYELAIDLLKRAIVLPKPVDEIFYLVHWEDVEKNDCEGDNNHFAKCHVLNNLGVLQITTGDTMGGFTSIKHAIQECHRLRETVFPELVFNYCKWLHDNKTKEMAEGNWRNFYRTELMADFSEIYKCVLK